jgi:hypothetical protein
VISSYAYVSAGLAVPGQHLSPGVRQQSDHRGVWCALCVVRLPARALHSHVTLALCARAVTQTHGGHRPRPASGPYRRAWRLHGRWRRGRRPPPPCARAGAARTPCGHYGRPCARVRCSQSRATTSVSYSSRSPTHASWSNLEKAATTLISAPPLAPTLGGRRIVLLNLEKASIALPPPSPSSVDTYLIGHGVPRKGQLDRRSTPEHLPPADPGRPASNRRPPARSTPCIFSSGACVGTRTPEETVSPYCITKVVSFLTALYYAGPIL